MIVGSRKFAPGLVPTLVVIVLFPILVRLGFWQLDRAEEKQEIQQSFEERSELPPVNLKSIHIDDDIKYRRVEVRGRFDSQHEILLDNKVHEQVVGYHVLTPLRLAHSKKTILVNRGWIAGSLDRSILPDIKTPDEEITVTGVISIPSDKVFTLSDYNRAGTQWPAVYQWIDFKDIQAAIEEDLIPLVILQAPEDAHGYVRNWRKVDLKPEKNISYAVQWFTLALALLVIYVVVNLKKIEPGKHDE